MNNDSENDSELEFPAPVFWDYASIWAEILEMKKECENLVKLLRFPKKASPAINAEIVAILSKIGDRRAEIRYLLRESFGD